MGRRKRRRRKRRRSSTRASPSEMKTRNLNLARGQAKVMARATSQDRRRTERRHRRPEVRADSKHQRCRRESGSEDVEVAKAAATPNEYAATAAATKICPSGHVTIYADGCRWSSSRLSIHQHGEKLKSDHPHRCDNV